MRRDLARAAAAAVGLGLLFLAAAGCGGRKRSVETVFLSPEARYRAATELLALNKARAALDEFGKIDQYSAENRQELEPLVRLGLADATFYQGTDLARIDARSLYLDFVTLYSDHPRAAYAQFQAGICSLSQVSSPSKDQSQTLQAIGDLFDVQRRFPATPFAGAARVMQRHAEANLAEHEFLIGRFYMKKKAYVAASERFRGILDRYPAYFGQEKIYYYLGQSLVLGNNADEGRIYLDKLVTDFPNGRFAEDARKALGAVSSDVTLDLTRSP